MQNIGERCPIELNFVDASFNVGDTVSYRVAGMDDVPCMGTLLEVHDDHVVIGANGDDPDGIIRGTRESRPIVAASEIR